MTDQELLDKIMADVSLDPDTPITLTTDLVMSGLVDSLGFMALVQWIEDRCSVSIDPAAMVIENFETPQHIMEFVAALSESA